MDLEDPTDSLVIDEPQQPVAVETSLVSDARLFEGYEAIEALHEASRETGWDVEYRQIEPGLVHAMTCCAIVGDTSILHETADRFMQVRAATPSDSITLMVGAPHVSLGVNGRHLSGEHILLLPPETEILANAPPPGEALQAHIPIDTFINFLNAMAPGWNTRILREAQLINVSRHAELIRNALLDLLTQQDGRHDGQSTATLVALIVEAIGQSAARVVNEDRYHWRQRWRALRRASSFIDDRFQQPIAIPELCDAAGVSLSTLERLFRREMDMTPKQYLLSRRLNSARRYIHESAGEKTIAEIAMRCGFTHFGRFSVAYRRQFGVRPSQDHRPG